MGALRPVRIGSLRLERFEEILEPDQYAVVAAALARARRILDGRVVWNVNSTARGGARGAIERGWLLTGDPSRPC